MRRCVLVAFGLLAASPAIALGPSDPLAPLGVVDQPTVTVMARGYRPASPDVFQTLAIDAGVTVYDARWRRVSAADLNDPRVIAIASATAGLDPVAKLASIHAAVRRQIVWRRDLDGYRVSDYWAQASETLDRGYGDSEDIAILKMQALKAAGFPPRDIYLSVGRDSVRGADTLLLVRSGGRFYALDDRAEQPLTAEQQARFVPIITLGKGSAWLHGKRYARATPARQARPSARPTAGAVMTLHR